MRKVRFVALASALAGLLLAGFAGGEARAQEKQVRSETSQEAQQRVTKERQVSGTVLGVKDVEFKGTGQKNTVALLRTTKNNRRLAVDLGPKKNLTEMRIKKGQQLAAKGVVVNVGDQPLLVASELKRGNKTLEVDRQSQIEALRKQQSPQKAQQRSPAQQPGMKSPQQQPRQRTEQQIEREQQRLEGQEQQMQRRQQDLERREQQMEKELEQEGEQLIE